MQAFKTALDNERAVEGYYDSMLTKFNALPAAQSVDRVNKLMDAFSSPENFDDYYTFYNSYISSS